MTQSKISLRLPVDLKLKLEQEAAKDGVPFAEWMRRNLTRLLEQFPNQIELIPKDRFFDQLTTLVKLKDQNPMYKAAFNVAFGIKEDPLKQLAELLELRNSSPVYKAAFDAAFGITSNQIASQQAQIAQKSAEIIQQSKINLLNSQTPIILEALKKSKNSDELKGWMLAIKDSLIE